MFKIGLGQDKGVRFIREGAEFLSCTFSLEKSMWPADRCELSLYLITTMHVAIYSCHKDRLFWVL